MKKNKIRQLIIGSNNKGKIREIRDLLPKNYLISAPSQFNLKSPKETGKTFKENSLIKAKYFSLKTKKDCLADDSGLEIDLLNKRPGIYSARWGGRKNNFNLAIKKVYKELDKADKNWRKKNVKARFICALTFFRLKKKPIQTQGVVEGKISKVKRGKKGFGYDPIFIPQNKKLTFAQMQPDKKYKIDHRFRAFKKIKKFF